METDTIGKKMALFDKKTFFFLLIATICLQFNEVKVFHIKFSEIGLLLLFPFLLVKSVRVNKYIVYFSCFFILLLLKTLVQNKLTTFYINASLPLLRQPYFISVSRFIELFCCLIFSYFIVFYLKKLSVPTVLKLLDVLFKIQIYVVGSILIVFFILYRVGVFHFYAHDGFLVYDPTGIYGDVTYRLKGLFIEGGPFGLFNACLYILYDWVLKQRNKKDLFGKIFLILIIFLAASKAGWSLMIVFLGINMYGFSLRSKYAVILKRVMPPLIIAGGLTLLSLVAANYIDRLKVDLRPDQATDQALVMGRVSGMVISPNIIANKYMMGIGLGNYPIVRNNPAYLGFFPEIPVDLWDSSGLGGLVDLMIDGGILFFAVFVFIFFKIYRDVKKTDKTLYPLLYSFIFPFIFGVQLYYLYPWFSLGLIIYFLRKKRMPEVAANAF